MVDIEKMLENVIAAERDMTLAGRAQEAARLTMDRSDLVLHLVEAALWNLVAAQKVAGDRATFKREAGCAGAPLEIINVLDSTPISVAELSLSGRAVPDYTKQSVRRMAMADRLIWASARRNQT